MQHRVPDRAAVRGSAADGGAADQFGCPENVPSHRGDDGSHTEPRPVGRELEPGRCRHRPCPLELGSDVFHRRQCETRATGQPEHQHAPTTESGIGLVHRLALGERPHPRGVVEQGAPGTASGPSEAAVQQSHCQPLGGPMSTGAQDLDRPSLGHQVRLAGVGEARLGHVDVVSDLVHTATVGLGTDTRLRATARGARAPLAVALAHPMPG